MRKRKIMIIFFVGMLVCLLSGCGEKTINLSEFVNVEFDGLNGYGTAKVTNYGLEGEIERVIYGGDDAAGAFEGIEMVFNVLDSVDFELDKSSELSNGDQITVNITVNEETAKSCGVVFKGTEPMTFTVAGLNEPKEIDPFNPEFFNNGKDNSVNVTFSGISPNGKATVENNLPENNPLYNVMYSVETNGDIEKGQEIVISAYDLPNLAEEGYILSRTETTIVCDKIDEYIRSTDDLSSEEYKDLIVLCKELIDERNESPGFAYRSEDGRISLANETGKYKNLKFTDGYVFFVKEEAEGTTYRGTIGDYFSNPSLSYNGLLLCFTVDLEYAKIIGRDTIQPEECISCCFATDLIRKKDGSIDINNNWGLRVNNFVYANEENFKASFIDPHTGTFDLSKIDISKF